MLLRRLRKICALIGPLLVQSMHTSGKSLKEVPKKSRKKLSHFFCRPFIHTCGYCHIKFHVIGHLEDSTEDTMYIAMKQNLTTLLPELIKKNRKTKRTQESSQDRIGHYMSQLNIRQNRKLLELYKNDFELFGYETLPS